MLWNRNLIFLFDILCILIQFLLLFLYQFLIIPMPGRGDDAEEWEPGPMSS